MDALEDLARCSSPRRARRPRRSNSSTRRSSSGGRSKCVPTSIDRDADAPQEGLSSPASRQSAPHAPRGQQPGRGRCRSAGRPVPVGRSAGRPPLECERGDGLGVVSCGCRQLWVSSAGQTRGPSRPEHSDAEHRRGERARGQARASRSLGQPACGGCAGTAELGCGGRWRATWRAAAGDEWSAMWR